VVAEVFNMLFELMEPLDQIQRLGRAEEALSSSRAAGTSPVLAAASRAAATSRRSAGDTALSSAERSRATRWRAGCHGPDAVSLPAEKVLD
jgi:hypothetical protein